MFGCGKSDRFHKLFLNNGHLISKKAVNYTLNSFIQYLLDDDRYPQKCGYLECKTPIVLAFAVN